MATLFYKRDNCRLCLSKDLDLVVPLAPMPLATPNFRIAPQAGSDLPELFKTGIPLEIYLCRACGHQQILHVGNPEIQYSNYVYTTSLSLGLSEHFLGYAAEVIAKNALPAESLLVEIGSNDGTLLRAFRSHGLNVLGIDPAKSIAERATASGVRTVAAFFSQATAIAVREEVGRAKAIVANNVIANIDDMIDFAMGIRELLAPDGVFIFETQYGSDVIERTLLDTVYHEHLSYFDVLPLERFFAGLGMQVIDVERIWTKGGSIRVTVQPAGGPRTPSSAVQDMIDEERRKGMFEPAYYRRLASDVASLHRDIVAAVEAEHAAGRTVAGYGVSVGTLALLPQFGLQNRISVLFDDDPAKDPVLSGPGYDIPVMGPGKVLEVMPGLIVVFAWRYAEPIIAKHQEYLKRGGRFLVPLPHVKLIGGEPG